MRIPVEAPRLRFPARILILTLALIGGTACTAVAGMPSYTLADLPRVRSLADVARMRLEVISFFLLAFLIIAAIVQAIWNGLRKDFTRLPRLSYFRSLGVIGLWGLLFLLVLTMISGARELMTPGAWEKVGATYRLAPDPPPIEEQISERFTAITRLRDALWSIAEGRSGKLPDEAEIPPSAWVLPGASQGRYVYLGGTLKKHEAILGEYGLDESQPRLIVVEPGEVGRDRLALFRDGRISWVSAEEIDALSRPEKP